MFKKHLLTLAMLASMGSMSLAQADQPEDTRWYAAPFGTFLKTGGDRNSHDGWGGGLAIGKILNKHFNVELKGFYQTAAAYNDWRDPTQQNVGGSWDMAGATADLQYFISRGTFSPYTVIGLGGMNSNVPNRSGAGFISEAGAGFTYEILDNLLLRSDVRYRYNQNFNAHLQQGTDEFHDMTVNLGVVVPFGDKPKAEQYVPPAPTPTPVAVADCSTLDSDADGVNDCNDKCAGTITGSKVDPLGCPLSLELKGVNFKYDSAQLTENAMFVLDGVAQSLINYPLKDDLEVHGHTSSEGSNAYNMKLSQKRSQSVANYLTTKGVTNPLHAKGFGESKPSADNNTEQGREQNRRVELIWMGH